MRLKESVLFVLFTLISLSCSKENDTEPAVSEVEQLVFNENGIPTNCQRYDDGCNTCTVEVLPNGNIDAYCTEVLCSPEAYKEPVCLDNNPQDRFELQTSTANPIEMFIQSSVPDISNAQILALELADNLSSVEEIPKTVNGSIAFMRNLLAYSLCLDDSLEGTDISPNDIVTSLFELVLNTEAKIDAYDELEELQRINPIPMEELRRVAPCELPI
jgi:hypothetical protein